MKFKTFWLTLAMAVLGMGLNAQSNPLSDQGNQTIKDSRTGLLWTKVAFRGTLWPTAVSNLSQLNLAGLTGWRLPTEAELLQLWSQKPGNKSPAEYLISQGFQTGYGWMWSATEDVPGKASGKARAVDLGLASWALRSKNQFYYGYLGVRTAPVTSPSSPPAGEADGPPLEPSGPGTQTGSSPATPPGRFSDIGNQILLDAQTQRKWTKVGGRGVTWDTAVSALSRLNLGGETGWRLPTEAELLQLYSQKASGQAAAEYLLAQGFQVSYGWFWTATEDIPGNPASKARVLNLGDGTAALRSKSQYNYGYLGVK